MMEKFFFKLTFLLFLSHSVFTMGKCMNSDEYLELSKGNSLISGYDFSKNKEKAGITVGISKKSHNKGLPHVYLAFEYLTEDKILLTGVDLLATVQYVTRNTNTELRPHEQVVKYFIGSKGSAPKFDKIRSFIVDKKKALNALEFAKEDDPAFCVRGDFISNKLLSDRKYCNCCTYIDKVLEKAGIVLGSVGWFITVPEDTKKATMKYCPPKDILKIEPPSSCRLVLDAKEKENIKKAAAIEKENIKKIAPTASWDKILVGGVLGAIGVIGFTYGVGYEVIEPYFSALGLM